MLIDAWRYIYRIEEIESVVINRILPVKEDHGILLRQTGSVGA